MKKRKHKILVEVTTPHPTTEKTAKHLVSDCLKLYYHYGYKSFTNVTCKEYTRVLASKKVKNKNLLVVTKRRTNKVQVDENK